MFTAIARSALALSLLVGVAVRTTDAAVSANCTLETIVLNANPTIYLQVDAIREDVKNQITICVDEQKDSCDVDPDYSSYETACVAEGGQIYAPTATFTCEEGFYTYVASNSYLTCVGASCDTEEFTEVADEMVQTESHAIKAMYDIEGVDCGAEISGAAGFGYYAVASATVMMAGTSSMMMMMLV